MSNGSNDFGVNFPAIKWLENVISKHVNVEEFRRTNDIQFDLTRKRGEEVRLICLDEYTCGLARVYEVLDAFPGSNIIYVGGNWNSYTTEAKEYCLDSKLGLYNSNEINGALHKDDYWNFYQKNREGNPIYQTKDT